MANAADAPYDGIAEWYDNYVRTEPLLFEVVVPAALRLIDETGPLTDAVVCDLACGQVSRGQIGQNLAPDLRRERLENPVHGVATL